MKLASYLSIVVSISKRFSITKLKNEKSFITVSLTSCRVVTYDEENSPIMSRDSLTTKKHEVT